jgi:hypothetical protein
MARAIGLSKGEVPREAYTGPYLAKIGDAVDG